MRSGLMFPKTKKTKRRTGSRAGSIMQKKDGRCWMCMKIHGDNRTHPALHKHHIFFGTGQRKISEKNGFYVWLCLAHHIYDGGPEAVHRNYILCRMLQRETQEKWEKAGHSRQEFINLVGRSYITD